jgi:hypothetical protein
MSYVYILSEYGEYGAESVQVTLDRANLPTMIDLYIDSSISQNKANAKRMNENRVKYKESLAKILKGSDQDIESIDGIDLSSGWGGLQLHVVRLFGMI